MQGIVFFLRESSVLWYMDDKLIKKVYDIHNFTV